MDDARAIDKEDAMPEQHTGPQLAMGSRDTDDTGAAGGAAVASALTRMLRDPVWAASFERACESGPEALGAKSVRFASAIAAVEPDLRDVSVEVVERAMLSLAENRANAESADVVELQVRRPRLASLVARMDAGEMDAIGELERRLRDDYRDLVEQGNEPLADAAWGWGRARIEDIERAEYYAESADAMSEAPACWRGLRVRVVCVGAGRGPRASEIAGRLSRVTDKGIHVLIDKLEEQRDEMSPADAGTIIRRAQTERFVTFGALLSVQPLPVREVRTLDVTGS